MELTFCTDKREVEFFKKMHMFSCQHQNKAGGLSGTFKFFSQMIEKVQPAALQLH